MVFVWHLCQSCMVAHSGKMEAVGRCEKGCGRSNRGRCDLVIGERFNVISIGVTDKAESR